MGAYCCYTDIDAKAEALANELQTGVKALHALQEQQLPGEVSAQLVMQVVAPVISTTPVPDAAAMDTTAAGAAPETTMGSGQLAKGTEMPTIFAETEEEQQE